MTKFNRKSAVVPRPAVSQHVIKTATRPTGTTALGAPGFGRGARSELYLLAVTNMVGESTFHEPTGERDSRFAELIHQVAVEDGPWTAGFLAWLRRDANMRTASIVGAIEFVKARLDAGIPDTTSGATYPPPRGVNRTVIDSVLLRPDEPGELMNYYASRYGRSIPKPIKKGVADAAARMYRDWSLLKYDTSSHEMRFADVLELTHPRASHDAQGLVYTHALNRRHGRKPDEALPAMITANQVLRRHVEAGDYTVLLSPSMLSAAGMTWEDALSLAGNHVNKAQLWEAIIPSMGYMALLRNLRNFDQAGVSDAVASTVAAILADPDEVKRSRQLPMRFLSAYNAAKGSLRWSAALNTALEHSLANIPQLPGRTLILIDTSYSMNDTFSKDGTLRRWDAAAIFGLALARRCAQADIVSFSSWTVRFPQVAGEALLRSLERFQTDQFLLKGGTQTAAAVAGHYAAHDRVVVLTDEQAQTWGGRGVDPDSVFGTVPATIPTYTWNLAGYKMGHAAGTANRHTFGGLTDASFRMIPLLDYGHEGRWPWEG